MLRMKRLIAEKADCMDVIKTFLDNHINGYTLKNVNTATNEDGTISIYVTLDITDNIFGNLSFKCFNNNIIDYDIYINCDSNNSNITFDDAEQTYKINEELNNYVEEEVLNGSE